MKKINLLWASLAAMVITPNVHGADFQSGDLFYNILDAEAGTVEVTKPTSGSYSMNDLVIPAEVSDGTTTYTVTSVGAEAFFQCNSIIHVTFPDGLKNIGKKAFYKCISITDVNLPQGLATIGGAAFEGCKSIKEITIPGSLNEWQYDYGNYARTFADCAMLTKLVVEEGVTSLPNSSFANLGGASGWGALKYIELPSTLTTAEGAFDLNIPRSMGGKIIMHSTTPVQLGDNVALHSWDLDGAYTDTEIRVPAEALDAYKADAFWGKFKRLFAIGAGRPEVPAPFKNAIGIPTEQTVSFSARWNDDVALDNLTELVYVEGPTTVKELIASVLKEDDRFYAMKESGKSVAYAFDTNGDHSRGIYVNGERKFMNVGLGYSVVTTDEISIAKPASDYDHWKVNSDTEEWKVFVNGTLATDDTAVNPDDAVVLEYCPIEATAPSEAPYTFYLRPSDQQGIWTQGEVVFDTANGKSQTFPMIANLCDDASYLYGNGIGTEIYELDGKTATTAFTASVANAKKGGMTCKLTVSSPKGVTIRPFLNIKKDWGNGTQEIKRIYGDADMKVSSVIISNPITGISLEGINAGDVIEVDNMGTFLLNIVYEPADADFKDYTASFNDPQLASIYVGGKKNYLVAHAAGETTMTLASKDGSVSSTYTVRVKDVDPTDKPDDDFQDGLVWLNEEWFTHTSGSLNYVDANGKIYYRAYGNQNGNMAFGATSQFGTTYAGKYIIMSKQAWDNGDTRPLKSGGRVVVFDAKTFKHIGSIDEIGGDGRACVGVNPSKVYLGTTSGIRVMNLDDITIADANIEGTATNGGQIGDMIKAGKYVFATNVDKALLVIDAETDQVVKTIEAKVQTIAQSKDGRIWIGCAKTLTPVDPETLEVGQAYNVQGTITCSGGSWRPGNLMASTKNNVLMWTNGNWNGNGGNLYRWNLDETEDPSTLTPIYTHQSKVDGNSRMGYGSCTYDDRTDTYIYSATAGFGVYAMQNWYYFVNATTGELKSCIQLRDYFWFPAMPICPDKYEPEITLGGLELSVKDGAKEYDLSDFMTDADNLDYNITVKLADAPESLADGETETSGPAASVALDGKVLTVTPLREGQHAFTLIAESNGRTVSKDINVKVNNLLGITSAETAETVTYTVYNVAGIKVATFEAADAANVKNIGLPAGIYLVNGSNGTIDKITVK